MEINIERLIEDEISLEIECFICVGSGTKIFNPPRPGATHSPDCGDCPECKGTGFIPSIFGKRMIKFMKKYKEI